MAASQNALSAASDAITSQLSQALLDWRVARITTDTDSPHDPCSSGSCQPTTRRYGDTTGMSAADFELWLGDRLHERKPNPYGFIPFVIFPNLREPKQFWGVSDLAAVVEPARELNRAMSQLSAILELSGNPIAVLENIENAEDIAVEPGAVWELPDRAKAYLLDLLQGGGVQLHASYIDLLYRSLHDLTETPRTSFGDNQKALSGVALPTIWLGPLLVLFFAVELRVLPMPGDDEGGPLSLLLPAATIGAALAAALTRQTRGAMLEVLGENWMLASRARGLSRTRAALVHGLRNALVPVVTVSASQLGALLGGAVVAEKLFERRGLGTLMLESFAARDIPVLQGTVLVVALLYVSVQLALDLVLAGIDPRVRLT